LPAPEPVVNEVNFIDLAVSEVRFDGEPDRGSVSTLQGLTFRELAAKAGVSLQTVEPSERHEARLEITPSGPVPQSSAASRGVQLTTVDRRLALSVFADQLTLQHTDYARFSQSFRPTLRAALLGARDVLDAKVVRRVGLRYVNRLLDMDATQARAWDGRVRPSMLGMLTDPTLGACVTGSQQQLQLDLGDACGATIRHGVFIDGAARNRYSYLVDLDVYCQATELFDVEAIMATVRKLNVTALSLFQWIVTAEWRATMRPHAADDTMGNGGTDGTGSTGGTVAPLAKEGDQ
jgi:uncharacterized protein (TIGR04255 family)